LKSNIAKTARRKLLLKRKLLHKRKNT